MGSLSLETLFKIYIDIECIERDPLLTDSQKREKLIKLRDEYRKLKAACAKAAKMVESYVKNKISRSLKIHNLGGIAPNGKPIEPILEATKVKAKTGSHRLLGLNLTSNQYGFIHHYGASSRTEHIVQL
ncbi:hypothetical protein [Tenacibaculum aiptasiae]|uniref:hypothetical protein n=1 Tax=Tenacibaculum aiptasiae TaxID=426481 RepID=UPI003B596C10